MPRTNRGTASDGTDTPAQLMQVARRAGVTTLALTDHDTTRGWAPALDALPSGLTLVRGAEISCQDEPIDGWPIPLHLLAYLFDAESPELTRRLSAVRVDRRRRAEQMVNLMTAAGLPVHWSQVEALAAGGTVGRPHIARALVNAGVVASVDAAFAGPVSWRSPYYIPKADIPVLDAIALVRAAGGVCVFAHPLRRGRQVGDAAIAAMADAGLGGIEVDHPDHSPEARRHLARLAADLDLAATGSSDYHGTNKSTPIAACTTDPGQFEKLIDGALLALAVG
jgi:predicted metal-dependent phosphoesterase TrpH